MLEALRNFVGSWVAKILLGLLVLSFAVWGVQGSLLGSGSSNSVVTVGDTNVPVSEYLATYNRNLNQISAQVGRRLTQDQARIFGIESRTLSDVATGATLDEFTARLSMSLSEETLARMINENPAFQDSSGKFSRDRFVRATREAGIRQEDFVRMQDAAAIRSQVMQAVAAGQILPAAFREALTEHAGEERKFAYITLTEKEAGAPPPPTGEQLKTYFDANLKKYAAPEYRKIAILTLEPKDIADEKAISDEDVKADYEQRIDAYRTAEKRRVQQLALSDKDAAQAALKSLQEGTPFETVLGENNLTVNDADLGLVEKSALPADLRDAAFKLEINDVSEIIETAFGPRIVRVTEISPETTRPLDEVAAEIRADLALRIASDRVTDMQTEVEDVRASGAGLKEVADQLNLKVRTVNAVSRQALDEKGNIINDLPNSRQLLEEAFKTEPGEQTSPLDYNSIGSLWYEVIDITPARDRTLDEVRDQVQNDWTAQEVQKRVTEKAEELKTRIEKGASLQLLAEGLGVEVKETGLLKRTQTAEGLNAEAVLAGFAGADKHVAIANGTEPNSRLLMAVVEQKRPEAQKIDGIDQEVERADQGAANDLLTQLITNLQTDYPVSYNPDLIQRALSRN